MSPVACSCTAEHGLNLISRASGPEKSPVSRPVKTNKGEERALTARVHCGRCLL